MKMKQTHELIILKKKNMACIQSRKRFENKCEVFIELTIKFRGGGDSGSALI